MPPFRTDPLDDLQPSQETISEHLACRRNTLFQSELAVNLFSIGGLQQKAVRTAEAAASVRQGLAIMERLPGSEPHNHYNLACAHALLARIASEPGSGMGAAEGQAEADRAMDSLRRAVAAGYGNLTHMRVDPDLDPLRSRPDFQMLLMDLAFPIEPFARGG
jgi:eukaryotic-like serine/threonine-protein kinase